MLNNDVNVSDVVFYITKSKRYTVIKKDSIIDSEGNVRDTILTLQEKDKPHSLERGTIKLLVNGDHDKFLPLIKNGEEVDILPFFKKLINALKKKTHTVNKLRSKNNELRDRLNVSNSLLGDNRGLEPLASAQLDPNKRYSGIKIDNKLNPKVFKDTQGKIIEEWARLHTNANSKNTIWVLKDSACELTQVPDWYYEYVYELSCEKINNCDLLLQSIAGNNLGNINIFDTLKNNSKRLIHATTMRDNYMSILSNCKDKMDANIKKENLRILSSSTEEGTLRILQISDLHLENHDVNPFILPEDSYVPNVAVVCGDIGVRPEDIPRVLGNLIDSRIEYIVFVLGNHDYWADDTMGLIKDRVKKATDYWNNGNDDRKIIFLDNPADSQIIDVNGHKFMFMGGTMWTDFSLNGKSEEDKKYFLDLFYDYKRINDSVDYGNSPYSFTPDSQLEIFKSFKNHLVDSLGYISKENDVVPIVVTHHAPTPKAVPYAWRDKGYDVMSNFAVDMTDIANRYKVPLWMFGHLHGGRSVKEGNTLYSIADYNNSSNPKGSYKIIDLKAKK